ncbi:MAG: zinc ribbon domain-containing protein [Ruminococcaceae bacterium]|nr:zinc ribbon domain-containing protein [Oscillospiraceae bacterium]
MALIKCPECNMNISDTTTQCVHCGYRIIKCVECGYIMPANAKICSNCGYEIKPSNHNNDTHNPKHILFDNFKDMFENWWSNSHLRRIIASNNHLTKGALMASAAFSLFSLIVLFLWRTEDGLSVLEKYKDVHDTYNVLLAFSLLFLFAYVVLKDFKTYFIINDLGSWVKSNNINLTFCIESYLNNDFGQISLGEIALESKLAKYAILTKETDGKQFALEDRKKILVISSIVYFVSALLIYMFLSSLTDMYMQFLLLYHSDSNPSFLIYFLSNLGKITESGEGTRIIILLLLSVASVITSFIYHKVSLRKDLDKMDSWAIKNIPHHLNEYNKYIKNVDTFIKNSASINNN